MFFIQHLRKKSEVLFPNNYSRNLSDPMWIGNDLLFVHSGSTGAKRIQLPSGVQMRAIIGPVKGVFKSGEPWQMEPGTTCGFLLEKVR